jgi:acetyl esterase/lipase
MDLDLEKFAKFTTLTCSYKSVKSQPIHAFVLVPKRLFEGRLPLFVKFHRGWLAFGGALMHSDFNKWIIDYIEKGPAILVDVEYRLLPESSGRQLLQDVTDFWSWLRDGKLSEQLQKSLPHIEADMSRIMVYGNSAGGLLALYSAFTQPAGTIKEVVLMVWAPFISQRVLFFGNTLIQLIF